jgi:hypothetical protein
MTRAIAGLFGGLVAWFLIATVGNLALRIAWTSYAEVEKAMTFTLAMMVARLLLGALSSLGAGLTVAWITHRSGRMAKALAAILLVLFIPVHYSLWDRFPLWYHFVFLASLVLMTLWGATLYSRATPTARDGVA